MIDCSSGSLWRKWDLHVHTPYSILNNQFGDSKNEKTWDSYVYNLFTKAIKNGICAIGLTDYFSIKGYLKVKEILSDKNRILNIFHSEIRDDSSYLEKIMNILLLPNIEFRSDTCINTGKKDSKLQFHVIFSDKIDPNLILGSFLNQLSIETAIGNNTAKYSLSEESLEAFGKECLKNVHELSGSALFNGYKMCFVSFDKVNNLLRENLLFKDKYLIGAVEEDATEINWASQASPIRKKLFSLSDFVFCSNPKSIKWYSSDACVEKLDNKKPCLWGSDSHSIEDLFVTSLNRQCWIKCDPTFKGLLESTYSSSFLNRIYIGDEPVELQESNSRKSYTIKGVDICNNGVLPKEKWFDAHLKINPFMCTIIGNKGSGKSALTDIISKCCNSNAMDCASFLNVDRFNKKTTNYGSHYRAVVSFADTNTLKIDSLDCSKDKNLPQYAEYLPQNYIEKVCNDIGTSFQDEVNKVIFSFISPADRLGSNNLEELINKKTETIDKLETIKCNEISGVNKEIISLEKKSTKDYLTFVENKLNAQVQRRTNHLSNKPLEVSKPDDIEADKLSQRIFKLSQEIDKEESDQKTDLERLAKLNAIKLDLSPLRQEVIDAENSVSDFNKDFEAFKNKYSLTFSVVFNLKSDFSDLSKFSKALDEEISNLITDTTQTFTMESHPISSEKDYENLLATITSTRQHKNKIYLYSCLKTLISTKTSEKNAAYLKYKDNISAWNKILNMIDGNIPDETGEGSIKACKDEIDYLKNKISGDLNTFKEKRIKLIGELYECIKSKENILIELYKPIQDKISLLLKDNEDKISFDVKIILDDEFSSDLFSKINASIVSKYKGTVEGKKYVDDMLNSTDFNIKESALNFVKTNFDSVTEHLDKEEQLLKNKVYEFYDFLSELQYLKVNFQLSMGGKSLKELSPGERGIVLLIFYLALGKDHSPLIIDQPEDNLDNQSIFGKLVPCIKEAKRSRQIIVVTHNPNIAIACDSEQVIFCSMDNNSKSIKYKSGSIENDNIKKNILDVLEGTKVAFDTRKLKYEGK